MAEIQRKMHEACAVDEIANKLCTDFEVTMLFIL